jgi:predicted kinase
MGGIARTRAKHCGENMATTLHFLCGKMGAGKTTLSRQLATQHNAILICEDIWLQRLFPVEIANFDDYLKYAARLKLVVAPHVIDLLRSGVCVVLDFPANEPNTRNWIRSLFESASAAHVLHFVNTPNERCINQLHKRNREQPEGSMTMTDEQFEHITSFFVEPHVYEGFNIKSYS